MCPVGAVFADLTQPETRGPGCRERRWDHEGIDAEQIRKSVQDSLTRRQAPRGASTITQQLAKNLYLAFLRSAQEDQRAHHRAPPRSRAAQDAYLRALSQCHRVGRSGVGCRGRGSPTSVFRLPDSRQQSALSRAPSSIHFLTPARPTRRLLRRQQIILARMESGGDRPAPPVATTPDLESDAESDAAPRHGFATVDEEEAQEGNRSPCRAGASSSSGADPPA